MTFTPAATFGSLTVVALFSSLTPSENLNGPVPLNAGTFEVAIFTITRSSFFSGSTLFNSWIFSSAGAFFNSSFNTGLITTSAVALSIFLTSFFTSF